MTEQKNEEKQEQAEENSSVEESTSTEKTDKEKQDAKETIEEVEIIDKDEQAEEGSAQSEEELEKVKVELKSLQEKYDQIYDRLLRVQAEYENYQKRTKREKESASKYKSQDLAEELLPVLDNFERALEQEVSEEAQGFKDGVEMVYRQLIQALETEGIETIKAVDEPFDPNLHHAVMQEEDNSKPENIVLEEMQKGYLLKDRVIRPAMVKVNK